MRGIGIRQNCSGIMMMEFIIVLPIYLFLWGAVYFLGYYAVLSGKTTHAGYILSRLAQYDIPAGSLLDYLQGDGETERLAMDNSARYFIQSHDNDLANAGMDSRFYQLCSAHVEFERIDLPGIIRGMYVLPDVLSGTYHGKDPTFSLGMMNDERGRSLWSWQFSRVGDLSEIDRKPMWEVTLSKQGGINLHADGLYTHARNYFNEAREEKTNEKADAYQRLFGDFFSSLN